MTTSCDQSWRSVIRSQIKTEKKNKSEKKVKGTKRKEKKKKKRKKTHGKRPLKIAYCSVTLSFRERMIFSGSMHLHTCISALKRG